MYFYSSFHFCRGPLRVLGKRVRGWNTVLLLPRGLEVLNREKMGCGAFNFRARVREGNLNAAIVGAVLEGQRADNDQVTDSDFQRGYSISSDYSQRKEPSNEKYHLFRNFRLTLVFDFIFLKSFSIKSRNKVLITLSIYYNNL